MVTVMEEVEDIVMGMVPKNLNIHMKQKRISMLKLLSFMLLVTFYNL